MWADKHVPDWWKFRWLAPIPKDPANPTVTELRPIMLLEVLRKCWTGLIVKTIMSSVERHSLLSESQHAFRRHRGTYTANLQIKNAFETAWHWKKKLYGSSWDVTKAFDSVSKAIIYLAWTRLGVPPECIDWLIELDLESKVAVRTTWAIEIWEREGLQGFDPDIHPGAPETFNPDRGTGQGDISSPHTWVAVFDILLRALELETTDPFVLHSVGGSPYAAPDIEVSLT